MHSAGLLYGNNSHYLDHLAPLCSLLKIPLVLYEKTIAEQAALFYPQLKLILMDPIEIHEKIILEYTRLFTCSPRPLFDSWFFLPQALLNKQIETIWVPHGHSDKGQKIFFFEGLWQEKKVLAYGKQMKQILEENHIGAETFFLGNYRYHYFKKHQNFYRRLLDKHFGKLSKNQRLTILFAPTWNDYERTSSSNIATFPLIDQLPSDINLILKPHPNLLQDETFFNLLQEKISSQKNICLCPHFSPIYPLLSLCDVLITDKSSIGYDFLIFDRPIFFPYRSFLSPIDQCGHFLDMKNPYRSIDQASSHDKSSFSQKRKNLYDNTFEKEISYGELRNKLLF